jgi:hypothetical protein
MPTGPGTIPSHTNPVAIGGSTAGGRVMAGIGLTILAYFIFSCHDAVIKWLVAGTTVWQILFIRSAVILTICLAVGRRSLLEAAALGYGQVTGYVPASEPLCGSGSEYAPSSSPATIAGTKRSRCSVVPWLSIPQVASV